MIANAPTSVQHRPPRRRPPGGSAGGLRDHRRPREGDDVPLAVPARAARAARLPDRRRRRRRLDGRPAGRARARVDRGHRRARSTRTCSTASRRGSRTSSGDFGDAATYERVAEAIDGASTPVFYLEIPPFLFGRVVQGLADAGLTKTPASSSRSRSVTTSRRPARSPTSCTSTSTSRSSSGSTTTSGRWASRRSSTCASRTRCSSRSGTATTSARADHDGRGLRRRGPRPLLRPGRRAARRRRQPPDAGGVAVRDGGAGGRRPADDQGRAGRALPRDQGGRPGALRPRPVRRLPRDRRRRARLDDRDVRRAAARDRQLALVGRAVLHPHRASACRSRRPSCGSSSSSRRASASRPSSADAEPNQLVVKLDPSTGIRLELEAHRADGPGTDRRSTWSSRPRAARARRPTRCCSHAAMVGDSMRFTRQDGVEETWRIMQPLLDAPPPVHPYAPGSWGPASRRRARRRSRPLARPVDRVMSAERHAPEPRERRRARRRRRRSRRSPTTRSCPNCHTGALVAPDGAIDWLCVPALRLAEHLRQPARPRGRLLPVRPVRHQPSRPPAATSRARTCS